MGTEKSSFSGNIFLRNLLLIFFLLFTEVQTNLKKVIILNKKVIILLKKTNSKFYSLILMFKKLLGFSFSVYLNINDLIYKMHKNNSLLNKIKYNFFYRISTNNNPNIADFIMHSFVRKQQNKSHKYPKNTRISRSDTILFLVSKMTSRCSHTSVNIYTII